MLLPRSIIRDMKTSTELRAVVDAFSARHAARRVAAGADKRPLLAAFKRMQRAAAADDYAAMAEADRGLHLAIVDLASVEGLAATWRVAAEPMEKFRVASLERCWPDLGVLFEAHRGIVDAILAGDAVAAEDAARVHLDAVWYRIADTSDDASLPDDPLARACAYLDLHLQQPLKLSFVAEHVSQTSVGHLARLFRQRYRLSFTEYVRELRMHKAVGLLTGTSQPIGRIARIVGYADASRFTVHFRRRYGLTPRAYRMKFGGVETARGD
jgi:AraC-like DNA-binding protein